MRSKKNISKKNLTKKNKYYLNNIIQKGLLNINIPFITQNLNKLIPRIIELNNHIHSIYDISKQNLNQENIIQKMMNLKNNQNNRFINRQTAYKILNSINQIDKQILTLINEKKIYEQFGGEDVSENNSKKENEDKNNGNKEETESLIEIKKTRVEKALDDLIAKGFTKQLGKLIPWLEELQKYSDGAFKLVINDEYKKKIEETNKNIDDCDKSIFITIKKRHNKYLKEFFDRWQFGKLLLLLLGSMVFPFSLIPDIILMCWALITGDYSTGIIIFFSAIAVGFGPIIKLVYLSYNVNQVVTSLKTNYGDNENINED